MCDDEPLPFSEYLGAVIAAAAAPRPVRLPAVLGSLLFGDVWRYFSRSLRISNAKLKAACGWQPMVGSAREGWPLTRERVS